MTYVVCFEFINVLSINILTDHAHTFRAWTMHNSLITCRKRKMLYLVFYIIV